MQGLETNQAWRTHRCVPGMSFKNRCISAGDGATAVAFLCIRFVPSSLCLWKRSIAEEWKGEFVEVLFWLLVIQFPPGKPWMHSGRKHCISLFYLIAFFKKEWDSAMFTGHGDFVLCCLAWKQRLVFSAEVIPCEVGGMGCSKDFGMLGKRCHRLLCCYGTLSRKSHL